MGDTRPTINKLEKELGNLKVISSGLSADTKDRILEIEEQLEQAKKGPTLFNERFSDNGWCAYDSMSFSLMEKANIAFEEGGIDAGERVLIDYYKTDASKITWMIKQSSTCFQDRYNLLQIFFKDHFEGKYYASVPLGLMIIDGAVSDFTVDHKCFFSTEDDIEAWDSLVGCDDGLKKLRKLFSKTRSTTNKEPISLPYRNGILHGRDLNYANEAVACKCLALMFAVANWMQLKNSEERRRKKYERALNPLPLDESLAKHIDNQAVRKEISEWKKRTVISGVDIPKKGAIDQYESYPYLVVIIEMLQAWEDKNYGKLSNYLSDMFSKKATDSARAGECRHFFENKRLYDYEICEVEERTASLTKVVVKVFWVCEEKRQEATLVLGVAYINNEAVKTVAVPWRDNGAWIIKTWDYRELLRPITSP